MRKRKTAKRFRYSRNQEAIEAWLKNVTSVSFQLNENGAMTKRAVRKLLKDVSDYDAAFITVSKEALCIHFGFGDQFRQKMYRFTK